MADRPLENELMMTTYTQLGQDLAGELDHLDVFIPSGVEEAELGFDMQLPNLKGIVLQFKRPKDSNPRRFRVRYASQDPPRQLDHMRNWGLKFGAATSFYALPLVVDHANLGRTLHRTAFIPASEINPWASIIRIPDDYIEEGTRRRDDPVTVYCSLPNNPSINWETSIRPATVHGWKELRTAIGSCDAGFRMRWNGQPLYGEYHDDHRWYPRPIDDADEDIPDDVLYDDCMDDIDGIVLDQVPEEDRFVGLQGPLFTRFGTEDAFSW